MAADPVAWPFAMGGEYSERLDWLTDVPVAPTGGTQHRRLRQSPRVFLALASLVEGRVRRRMEALLRDHAARQWRAPVAVDSCRLGAAADAADTVLTVDTGDSRFEAEGYVLLQGADPLAAEVVQIATGGVASGALTLDTGVVSAWPIGTLVTPLRMARLVDFPQVGRFTSDATDVVDLTFRLEEPLDDAAEIAGDTYRDFPVWPFAPVWSPDPTWVPERALLGQDDEIAKPLSYDLSGAPQGRTTMQYTLDTREGVVAFRKALFALAGRWSPAWVPSWASDLRIVATVADGATSIDIEAPVLAGLDLPDNHRDLRIALRDGTVLYRRITGVTTPAPGVERIALGSAIATGFAAADVQLVSFMVLCVQDADTNLLRYWTRDVMDCELTWRQLVHGL